MFKKIMIATDGSEMSMLAAVLAVGLAKISGATVTAIYVLDVHRLAQLPGYTEFPGLNDRLMKLMFTESNEAMSEIAEIAQDAGISYEKVVAEGNPSDEILRRSQELGMDLLVMGSIGRSGLNKFLLGSVAEKVVRHSKIPVLIVPGTK
ncbi:MAG: universal stress protein [Methanotrichaceae archaeon]|nr:universal stress protein [Methanotrichaceae archaeon]